MPAFWDHAMYANMAQAWFAQSGAAAAEMFRQSFDQKYNLLFALPSWLGFTLAEPSRFVFILTNFVAFFVPYQLVCAFGLRQIFGRPWPQSIFAAVALCWLVPFGWYPLLEGYPDHGAATALVLAIGLLLDKRRDWRRSLSVGLLLGLAILFRRHYAYPVLAVLMTAAAFDAPQLLKAFKSLFVRYALMGLGLLGVLIVCEPLYLKEILTTDYTALYKSYERGALYFVHFTLARAGLLVLVAVLAGYVLAARAFPRWRFALLFCGVLFFVWLVLWAVGPAQAGQHYLISLFPFLSVVGLMALFEFTQKRPHGYKAIGAIAALLFANAVHAFCLGSFVLPSDDPRLSIFGTPRPPWIRQDKDELRSLAAYIAQTTTSRDKIAIAGSSFIFNQDLIRALYTDDLNDIATALRFIPAPESDGEQEPPLDVFAAANVYLVATPAQYHLPPEGQKVVTGLTSLFPPRGPWVGPFNKDARSFNLTNGVRVDVWRREALSPQQLHQALLEIRVLKDTDRLWITSQTDGAFRWSRERDNSSSLIVQHGGGVGTTTLFYDAPMPVNTYRVHTLVRILGGDCEDVHLIGRTQTADGRVLKTSQSPVLLAQGPVFVSIASPEQDRGPVFLSVQVQTKARTQCTVALWQLGLEQFDGGGLSIKE